MVLPTKYLTAIKASIEASSAISEIYQNEVTPNYKTDGSPVTIADFASSKILRTHLAETNIPIVGEEGEIPPYETRNRWEENWCIDPLDGTKMFLQRNDEFCVCIAHLIKGKPAFGIIADPVNENVLCGGKEFGVFQFSFNHFENTSNWKKIQKPISEKTTVTGSRSMSSFYEKTASELLKTPLKDIQFRKKGSALKFFDLANGEATHYLRLGPTMEWDIAAGQAIVEAIGGTVKSIKTGEILVYNKENLLNEPFLIQM